MRTVTLHVPMACAVGGAAYAQYYELGDFEPSAPMGGHVLDHRGETLPELDGEARSLLVEATENSRTWSGITAVPASGNVDVLVLPSFSSCAFSSNVGARAGALLAAIPGNLALVIGGGTPANPNPSTYVANLNTGTIQPVPATADLRVLRTGASVTTFGDGALVAGGVHAGAVQGSAERYSPDRGFAQQQPILLSEPRVYHGAVVLAGGQTLLVGGVGADGKTVLGSMEIVDPGAGTAHEENVALLAVPRRAPTVLRLASGEILVAGGFDSTGALVPTIEWFSSDASHATKSARDLVAGSAHAFIALDGGGALAVIAPPAGAQPGFQNVWVIDADGVFEAGAPLAGSVTQPVLFRGAGGAPVLWVGDGSPDGRWLRWQPWQGAFGALEVLGATPARPNGAVTSPDPGLALWLDDAPYPALTALRFDTRGEYSTLGPLLTQSATDVAPDRLAAPGVELFDPSTGLELGPGASAFVTDRTYAAVSVDLDAPTGEPALVVLRDELGAELEVGGVACEGALAKPGRISSLHVERSGDTVEWAIAGGAHGVCPSGVRPDARLSVGVRAPGGVSRSVVHNLRILRLGP